MNSLPTLAQSARGMASVFFWSLALIALVLVGFFAVVKLRQWLKSDDEPVGTGFSLSDLRQLHRQGMMTDEEFERAKGQILTGAKAMAAKLPDPLARDRRPPPPPPSAPEQG